MERDGMGGIDEVRGGERGGGGLGDVWRFSLRSELGRLINGNEWRRRGAAFGASSSSAAASTLSTSEGRSSTSEATSPTRRTQSTTDTESRVWC